NKPRSNQVVFIKSHPVRPAARAANPAAAVTVVHAIFPPDPFRSSPTPSGCKVNMNGTKKVGSVYFQAIIVVLYGLPPVIAAAAKGESAVGGETSERTA